jgi:hypothetical protein
MTNNQMYHEVMSIFSPLQHIADFIALRALHLQPDTLGAEAVSFFFFDTMKILILLVVIIFIVSLIRSFLPIEKVRDILSRRNAFTGHVLASLLGIITPFCTCSAIPLFLGFIEAGVPLGITFSFLVASPMINEVALVMLLGLFGWKVSLIYITSGLIIAILSGIIIGKLKVEHLVESAVLEGKTETKVTNTMTWQQRFTYAWQYTGKILARVWVFVVLGVGIGAWIHGYVPTDLLAAYAGRGHWYAVPVATLIGIPLYSNVAGIIPLVGALTEKGVSLGTALAFMMAVTGLSLPEFLILRRVMKIRLIVIFAAIVGIGIMFTGFLFNAILA